MFSKVARDLKRAKILPGGLYHKQGGVIVHELLKKGSISADVYSTLVDEKIGEEMLGSNAFACHFNAFQITFQSTLVKRFCEQESHRWKT